MVCEQLSHWRSNSPPLRAKLPPAASHAGQKIWVTDLHEGLAGYCASDGVNWIPDRASAIATRSAASAIQLKPLVHRPVQRFTATIPLGGLAVTSLDGK